jgi:hypothetical protein
VDARLADERSRRKQDDDRDSKQMALGITSMALGIPISAIAAGTADLPGLVASWAGHRRGERDLRLAAPSAADMTSCRTRVR